MGHPQAVGSYEQSQGGSGLGGSAAAGCDGVCAEGWARLVAEPGRSGELRFEDHAGAMRCSGQSAEVQERAGDVPQRV